MALGEVIERVPAISLVVPTLNSAALVPQCLAKLVEIANSEIIVVDNHSADGTRRAAAAFGARIFDFGPDQSAGRVFGAPAQRNYGAACALSEIVYFVDVDMLVGPEVVAEALALIAQGADAVIVAEESIGVGYWAKCKTLERQSYRGDDDIEAPRILRKSVLAQIGGLSTHVAADDWDLANRLRAGGYKIARTQGHILHDEGHLTLRRLALKRYLYGQQMASYLAENGVNFQQTTPFRRAYFKNWRRIISKPHLALGMVLMRGVEFAAGGAGLALQLIRRKTRWGRS